jgi:hypothetical protein
VELTLRLPAAHMRWTLRFEAYLPLMCGECSPFTFECPPKALAIAWCQLGRAKRRAAARYAANSSDGSPCSLGSLLCLWSRTRHCTTRGLNCSPEHLMISRTAAATDLAAL